MIRVERLTKRYGKTLAVHDLSFELTPGRVTGFLGPNGSGKSTTMRCIVGLDRPTAGHCTIGGLPYAAIPSPLTTVGCLLDGRAFHSKRTARNHLQITADTHGFPRKRVDEVLELTGIAEVANQKVKGFSLGMTQRLGIAHALIGDPQVLIFDEPVNGLDPDGVRWIRELLRSLAAQGRTILVSSHLMSEMALTADELVVIGRGQLIAQGPITQFTESAERSTIHVSGPDIRAIIEALNNAGLSPNYVEGNKKNPHGTATITGSTRTTVGHILHAAHLEIHELSESYSSLEDVFMELTSQSVQYKNSAPYAPPGHDWSQNPQQYAGPDHTLGQLHQSHPGQYTQQNAGQYQLPQTGQFSNPGQYPGRHGAQPNPAQFQQPQSGQSQGQREHTHGKESAQ